ncbi:sugar phosphate nucleotidyltransferase [Limnochorda pilosa]|uniref:Glucose-1-phosphate thymidylyltransferase n=1 Tax=Limnochorda pilosa TaxID=1555112 RepID=A0A0K2SLT0_LIMPI|nr:sugar phosphate nucleotidyltransferase [Limnochorda pilosa]BAS27967.1 spore coat protein [Limnochorda pilosa]
MKGVILAGGTGSRLFPLTKVTNKHLLPVGRYPMIYHPIAKLAEAGVHDVLVVTGTEHMGDVVGLLGSGRALGMEFTYRVQDEAGGIAQALGLAEGFVGEDRCVVILGDNIFEESIAPYVERFAAQEEGARILLKEVPDPERYGVAEIEGERIAGIEEKPRRPKSAYSVTGVYMYDARVFDIVKTLRPSRRGELEITDVNNAYIRLGMLHYDILQGWWTDAGTPASLALANRLAEKLVLPVFEADEHYRVGASAQEIASARFE